MSHFTDEPRGVFLLARICSCTSIMVFAALLVMLTSASLASDLPPCPSSEDEYWDNCHADHTFVDGSHYVGSVRDDMRDGDGMQLFSTGEVYLGQFRQDLFDGLGVYTSTTGEMYFGEFFQGLQHGLGITLEGSAKATACRYNRANVSVCTAGETIDDVLPVLRSRFQNWPHEVRTKAQRALDPFYTGAADGSWGKETLKAVLLYSIFQMERFDISKKEWQEDVSRQIYDLAIAKRKPENELPLPSYSTGTGFFVSPQGHLITNQHVISGCSNVSYIVRGEQKSLVVIGIDERNDLAILKASSLPDSILPISRDPIYPLQSITVAGFPFGANVSSVVKFTGGVISATSGIKNDYSTFQFDASIQPGNSGGPVIDEFGNVIGVVVSKLSRSFAESYGALPEGTNFGVKINLVEALLSSFGVEALAPNTIRQSRREIAASASASTVMLICEQH